MRFLMRTKSRRIGFGMGQRKSKTLESLKSNEYASFILMSKPREVTNHTDKDSKASKSAFARHQ